jgi:uncharacterized protein (DUF2461 family)
MSNVLPHQHAFNHVRAALRIYRFAADTAPRVLEIAHVSAFLRECAVEFGSADATLPGAIRNEYANWRYFTLRAVVERRVMRCPWLADKLLTCRNGAPIPAAALALDVTRHDVNWGAEGARLSEQLTPTHGGFVLNLRPYNQDASNCYWAQGPVGVTTGSHYFQLSVTAPRSINVMVGWVDDKLCVSAMRRDNVGKPGTLSSGAVYFTVGSFYFGTSPLAAHSVCGAPVSARPSVFGCLLDLDATPARMTVFVNGEPLTVQCPYSFPKDRAFFPTVALFDVSTALHSCEV